MLGKLLKFETKLQTRQIGFWIAAFAMMVISALIMSTDVFNVSVTTGEKVKANGALTVAVQTGVFNLGTIFFGALFVVAGVMRDQTYKMLEIVHATQVKTFSMTASRIFGAFLATYICVIASSIGLFIGQFSPFIDQEAIGPVNLMYFLQPALVFTPINALFVTAFFTLVAGLTRNRTMVYVSAVGLLMVYFASGIIVGEDPPDLIGALSDPFGMNALAIATEYWPAAQQNESMVPVWGWVGINRLVWFGVSMLMLAGIFTKFKRGLVTNKTKRGSEKFAGEIAPIKLAPVTPSLGPQANFRAFLKRLQYEYKTTVRSAAFMILLGLALVFFGIAIAAALYLSPEKVRPTSMIMNSIAFGSLFVPMIIITVFFGGEILWRDKVAGITEIIDSTPSNNWPFMLAKWIGLILVLYTILTVGMVFTMIVQTIVSDVAVDIGTYFRFTYLNYAPDFIAFAILTMFVQNFMPNRVVGMLVSAGLLAFIAFFLSGLPFYHPLMGFGAGSTGGLSEINGFNDLTHFKWFNIYWGSFCGLMAVFSIWVWRRGLQVSLIGRLKSIHSRLTGVTGAIAALLLATFVGSGAYIYKAYNIDGEYRNQKAAEKRQVAREIFFATEFKMKVPKIQSVEVDVNFWPSKREGVVKGQFIIKNVHDEPVTELYVSPPSVHPEYVRQLDIKGAERVTSGTNSEGDSVEQIEDYKYYLYRFNPPLAPGAETTMTFNTFYHAPKLYDGSPIKRNGTFVNNGAVMPTMGIRDSRMRNPDKRRKYGLPELESRPDRDDMEARQYNLLSNNGDYVDFKSKMCTEPGQIAISPGKLLREYQENGQACRDYEAINPILNFFSFLSADYTVKKDVWKNPNGQDVEIVVYYHDKHFYNVDLMIDAVKSGFDTYTTLYGPYRYHQLRIMEVPYIGFAQAFAGTVPFAERGFILDPGKEDDVKSIDRATAVTMHELGHQWFAHQIVPGDVKGFNILSEGLTENASTTAYEAKYGWQKARQSVEKQSMDTYLVARAMDNDKEAPLALAGEQGYLHYQKSDWVFWGLKQYMGEEKMQGAIRAFLEEYGSKGPPYPTTKELVDYLRAAAGPDYQQLITDYWDRITFWELEFDADGVDVKPNGDGGFTVTVNVDVDKKIASEDTGKETSVTEIDGESLDEWIEIGFYDKDPKDTLGDEWLVLERVKITQPKTKLTFDMEKRPTFVLLDPRRLLIERNVKDNVKNMGKGKLASKE